MWSTTSLLSLILHIGFDFSALLIRCAYGHIFCKICCLAMNLSHKKSGNDFLKNLYERVISCSFSVLQTFLLKVM